MALGACHNQCLVLGFSGTLGIHNGTWLKPVRLHRDPLAAWLVCLISVVHR
jgi:hypothetical protein